MKIAEFAKNGLTNLEIVDHVNHFIKHMRTYFLLDRFDTLAKTGRINPYVAKLASMLNIKPICGGDENGNIKMFEKARGYNKAVKRLIEIIRENTPDLQNRVVGISHVKCLEKAIAFKDELLKTLKVKDAIIMEATGLVASYACRGGFVIAV
jgi:DegV family protein with EDD domain